MKNFRKLWSEPTNLDFLTDLTYIYTYIIGKTMKRITRQRSEETKRKISESLRGKIKTEQHKRAISVALKKYWKTIPPTTVR